MAAVAPRLVVMVLAGVLAAGPALAVLDVEDQGPTLRAGRFEMRVTNVGVVGNPYFYTGRSYDPSFEFPRGSGQELLNYAALWVGAIDATGQPHVSGGSLLEWRPTPAPDDTVREVWHGRPGMRQGEDDDGDGRVDEEILNDRDDDGDGETDEDLGITAQQALACDYVDDRPEGVRFNYGVESHHPLHLSVHQEAYAWSLPGYDTFAGITFHITNHGDNVLTDVRVGLMVDADSRGADDATGHTNDRVIYRHAERSTFIGWSLAHVKDTWPTYLKRCVSSVSRTAPILIDGGSAAAPALGMLPLAHTTDPLALVAPELTDLPAQSRFLYSVFSRDQLAGQGGPPAFDSDRFAALGGEYPVSPGTTPADYVVLVSCVPFPRLAPGESVDFSVALCAGENADSVVNTMAAALYVQKGSWFNLLPDSARLVYHFDPPDTDAVDYRIGETGLTGHEVCLEPPAGTTFRLDPHCPGKYDCFFFERCIGPDDRINVPPGPRLLYTPGHCIWTDADCDACTGFDGNDALIPWLDAGAVPPIPNQRVVPGDHRLTVEWDNLPEILLSARRVSLRDATFAGYRVYLMSNWQGRRSEMPPMDRWALHSAWGIDTLDSQGTLRSVTDTTLDYDRIVYGSRLYPVGRYRVVIDEVQNGFDYGVVVTTVAITQRVIGGTYRYVEYESPITVRLPEVVAPRATARDDAKSVWVVPNPYRGQAAWDRPPVAGDPLPRHVDFMGLPRGPSTIKIWTLAGDLVATVDNPGENGDGQASWNLISRNGQEVASGIYLFTVESRLGHSTGRFVVIR